MKLNEKIDIAAEQIEQCIEINILSSEKLKDLLNKFAVDLLKNNDGKADVMVRSSSFDEETQIRAKVLLKATSDILNKCNNGGYVKDVMSVTAIWDEAECDGNCLLDEVDELLYSIEMQP